MLKVSFDDESMFKHAIIIIIHRTKNILLGNLGDDIIEMRYLSSLSLADMS